MIPKEDDFLSDPKKLHYRVICIECRKPLWETKILKVSDNHVVSTETVKLPGHQQEFSNLLENCPICRKRFYAYGKRGHLYLIQDQKSKITRLI